MSADDLTARAARRTTGALADRSVALLLGGLAILAALAARALWPFDGLYGQDAFAYFRYARALWPWLLHGDPLPIYYWPAGYPILVALVMPLSGWSSAAGQIVGVAAAASAAGLTFLLCRELLPDAPGGRSAALVAGLIVALSGAALRAGLVVMADAAALACCAAALWALARYLNTGRARWLAGSALALGWAIITRWECGLLALPMLAGALAAWRSGRRPLVLAHWLAAAAVGALVVVPQVIVSGATGADPAQHQWVVAWNIASAWHRTFTTVDGTQHYALPVAAFYLAQMAWPSFLAPPLALFCPAGALWLARRRSWPALALLAGWPLALWIFLSGIPYENSRFVLPALPALAGLAGLGFGWAAARGARIRRLLAIGLVAALAAGLAWGARDYRKLVAYADDQLALVDWVRARLPADATLITFGATLTLQHYTGADVRELYYLDPPDLDAISRAGRPTFLLLDVGGTESQWAGLRPQIDYHHLLDQPGLEPIGERPPYTLFRLKDPRR